MSSCGGFTTTPPTEASTKGVNGRNYPGAARGLRMSYRTTIGWSLLTSGLVTLLLTALPYPSLYWGILLIVVGVIVLLYRQT